MFANIVILFQNLIFILQIKTYIGNKLHYCLQLWMSLKATGIQDIEKLQKDFLNTIPEIKELNYWDQLKHMNMLFLQRRLERYIMIYAWNILEDQAPNCGITWTSKEGRKGKKCEHQGHSYCIITKRTDIPSKWPSAVQFFTSLSPEHV